jgi:UDPglucose--hexose-1-phosphate uridylyltransferase
MGCSNPHPRTNMGAIVFANQVEKTQNNLKTYFDKHNQRFYKIMYRKK